MNSITVGDRLVTDISPHIYKVTNFDSQTEISVLDLAQYTEHKIELSGGKWKFVGVSVPHDIDMIKNNPIQMDLISIGDRLVADISPDVYKVINNDSQTRILVLDLARNTLHEIKFNGGGWKFVGASAPHKVDIIKNNPIPTVIPRLSIVRKLDVLPKAGTMLRTNTQEQALSEYDWIDLAEANGLLLTWAQLQSLPDDTEIVADLRQIYILWSGIVTPEEYWEQNKTTIGDVGRNNFYNYDGLAVLGRHNYRGYAGPVDPRSRASESMLWQNIRMMPLINADLN